MCDAYHLFHSLHTHTHTGWAVLIFLNQRGIKYTSKLLSYSKGEHKTPAMQKLSPRASLPVYADEDGVVLDDPRAIIMYLELAYAKIGYPALFPTEIIARARCLVCPRTYVLHACKYIYMHMNLHIPTRPHTCTWTHAPCIVFSYICGCICGV